MMGPIDVLSIYGPAVNTLLLLGIGFLFGFILESAGFGDSRRLAGQFYFRDLAVLRVMFSAIVTAMLLIFTFSAIGKLDYDLIWVNPTYWHSGILGGLIMGAGFIIGGYCPGTSLVSMATFKIDGLFFVLGAAAGMFLFAEFEMQLADFMQLGSMGRITLMDVLGLPAGLTILLVLLMAVMMFGVSTWVMRQITGSRMGTRKTRLLLIPAMLAIAFLLTAGQPGWQQKWVWRGRTEAAQLEQRQVQIEPAELALLLKDDFIELRMFDIRSESDYNLFHLEDAERYTPELKQRFLREAIPPRRVVVLMSNDEENATLVWKELRMAGQPNIYILSGGINRWLSLHQESMPEIVHARRPEGLDELAWRFPHALGAGWPASRLDESQHEATHEVERKVKLTGAVKKSGGCG